MRTILKYLALLGGNPMQSIASNFQFWSDGTTSGSQLLDKSGNNRHATLTSNLITDGDSEFGSVLRHISGTVPTVNESSTTTVHGGTRSRHVSWTSIAAFSVVSTENFVVVAGQTYNYSFWFYKVSSTNGLAWNFRQGDGSTNSLSAQNFNGVTQNVWTQRTGSFTPTVSGGLGSFYLNPGASASEHDIYIDDITLTVTGQTNNCFIMADDATLKSTDTLNHFYSSSGIPLTTRADYQYNSYQKKIVCGGAFSYIFLNSEPTISTYKILHDNFIKYGNDHAFDSCPIELTCGSGGTYALPQNAIAVATVGNADFRHRRRIKLLSDISVTTYAGYTVVSGGGFMAFIQMNRAYDYITSDGTQRVITATKEASLNDTQSSSTEVLSPVYTGGIRGITINKTNGGYLWHQDFTGMVNSKFIAKNCIFNEDGAQEIYDYRTNNAQPQPIVELSQVVHAGGMHNGFIEVVDNCILRGMKPYTWQDAQVTSGNGGHIYMNNTTLDNEAIYDVVANPTSAIIESIRLTSSGGTRSTQVWLMGTTRESTVNEIGAVKSIFLTEL